MTLDVCHIAVALNVSPTDEEDETETEQQQHADHDSSIMVIQVICADVRFEPGTTS